MNKSTFTSGSESILLEVGNPVRKSGPPNPRRRCTKVASSEVKAANQHFLMACQCGV